MRMESIKCQQKNNQERIINVKGNKLGISTGGNQSIRDQQWRESIRDQQRRELIRDQQVRESIRDQQRIEGINN